MPGGFEFFLGFFFFFFFFDRPTQYQETHSMLNEKKKKGWPQTKKVRSRF